MSDRSRSTDYSDCAEFYDYGIACSGHDDADFFVRRAVAAGGPVLDLGCGTGRVLLPLARAGVEVVGLDSEEAMLAICRAKLDREHAEVRERITLIESDMRDFDLGKKFSLIMIPFRSFQHLLTPQAQLACLASVRRHLTDDGAFVLDVMNPYLPYILDDWYLEEHDPESEFIMPDGRRVVRKSRIVARDPAEQVLRCETIYYVTHPDGRAERRVGGFAVRYVFRWEAEHLLARAGFRVDEIYYDYDSGDSETDEPEEIIFVASKQ